MALDDMMSRPFIGRQIVGDLERLFTKCGACKAATARMIRIDGNLERSNALKALARGSRELEQMRVSFLQKYRGRSERLTGACDRIANEPKHFLAVRGA